MSAEQYLWSLDPSRRPEAREWADMSPREFQARVGITLSELAEVSRDNASQVSVLEERINEIEEAAPERSLVRSMTELIGSTVAAALIAWGSLKAGG